MVKLAPLSEEDYQSWHDWALEDYASDIVRSGMPKEQAEEKSRSDFEQGLPNGLNSENQYLYSVQDEQTGEKVGVIWLAIQQRSERKVAFLYDIVIWEPFRGKGYGTAALQATEDRARELGAVRIGLHVFGHNEGARKLYKRLGYVETNVNMSRDLV
jgi:RimJ/RimL family protein N-acetyltransferase